MFEVFKQTTPLVEALSIDEAFLEVGGLRRVSGTPTEVAVRLRREVLERVGLPITVGVARTKFLAKVASGVAKPDGLLVVPPDRELAFLHPLPVGRLWGVGPVSAEKLERKGITTVGEVARSARRRSRRPLVALLVDTSTRSRTTATPAGAGAPASPFDRFPARPRPQAANGRRHRRGADRFGRPRHPPHARRGTRRSHGRAAVALRRLLTQRGRTR